MKGRDEILEHHTLVMRDGLSGPAAQPHCDPVRRLVFSGGRDMVSDVWVAGRQLLSEGQFTRLDWPNLAALLGSPAAA